MEIQNFLSFTHNDAENLKATQFNYQLQGVVAHIGTDATSGHYVTFIHTSKGWNLFDDSNIRQVSETEVFKHDAYILFYQKHNENTFIAQNNIIPSNDIDDASSKVQWKCTLLQSVLLCDQSKFAEIAQGIKQKTQKVSDENGATEENDHHAVLSDGFISRLLKQGEHGGVVEVIFKESDKNRKKVFHLNTDHLMCLNPFASGHSPLINDHVMNAYTILIAQSCKNAYPMNSLTVANLSSNCWKQDKLFAFDYWIAPIHLNNHWAMLVRTHQHEIQLRVIDLLHKTFHYNDSLDSVSGYNPINRMMKFMEQRCILETGIPICWKDWKIELHYEFPEQHNAIDCGIFALKAAYSQKHMVQARYEILVDILNGKFM